MASLTYTTSQRRNNTGGVKSQMRTDALDELQGLVVFQPLAGLELQVVHLHLSEWPRNMVTSDRRAGWHCTGPRCWNNVVVHLRGSDSIDRMKRVCIGLT